MNIHILHRDLRLNDNTSLITQLKECKSTTIIFIFTPEQINKKNNEYYNSNSVQFMIESLHELSNEIKKKNGKLYFFYGDTIDVLNSINKDININSISYNIDYSSYSKYRDNLIEKWADKNNIKIIAQEDYLLYNILEGLTKKDDGVYYKVYTAFKNNCMKKLTVREIDKFNKFKFKKYKLLLDNKYYINEKDIDNFYNYNEFLAIRGGRSNALKILKNIDKWKDYNNNKDFFNYKTTHLSSHNHYTTISIRELYWTIIEKLGNNNQLINELHWRDFFTNICHFNPQMTQHQIMSKYNETFKEKFNNIKWNNNIILFNKWETGNIGVPLIDACMRELIKTGYMNGRGRMLVSSFITKNVLYKWYEAEKIFAKHLVDYSIMMNIGNWNWQIGGIDPKQYLRIFNPYIQSKKFDKDALYIKKWIPELNNVNSKDIHNWEEKAAEYIENGCTYILPQILYKKSKQENMKELLRINKI